MFKKLYIILSASHPCSFRFQSQLIERAILLYYIGHSQVSISFTDECPLFFISANRCQGRRYNPLSSSLAVLLSPPVQVPICNAITRDSRSSRASRNEKLINIRRGRVSSRAGYFFLLATATKKQWLRRTLVESTTHDVIPWELWEMNYRRGARHERGTKADKMVSRKECQLHVCLLPCSLFFPHRREHLHCPCRLTLQVEPCFPSPTHTLIECCLRGVVN